MEKKRKEKKNFAAQGTGGGGIGRATHAHARSARCGCAESHFCRAQVQREAESRGLRSSSMSQAKKSDLLLQREVSASVATEPVPWQAAAGSGKPGRQAPPLPPRELGSGFPSPSFSFHSCKTVRLAGLAPGHSR